MGRGEGVGDLAHHLHHLAEGQPAIGPAEALEVVAREHLGVAVQAIGEPLEQGQGEVDIARVVARVLHQPLQAAQGLGEGVQGAHGDLAQGGAVTGAQGDGSPIAAHQQPVHLLGQAHGGAVEQLGGVEVLGVEEEALNQVHGAVGGPVGEAGPGGLGHEEQGKQEQATHSTSELQS